MLKTSTGGNPMKQIIRMQSEAYKEGRNDMVAELKQILGECPDCPEATRVLVLQKLRKLI